MPVLHPSKRTPFLNDAGQPITITVHGRNSAAFQNLQVEFQRRGADRTARSITLTNEEAYQERAEIVAACTMGWTFDSMDGQPFPFSAENAERFWSDGRWRWLLDEAYLFIAQDGNFLAS
jgi:hypothetical protein